jgi:hypothetical protein
MGEMRIGEETYRRILAHATSEPSFTAPFLAWDMGIPAHQARIAVARMVRERRVDRIEERQGFYAAVYVVRPVRHVDRVSRPLLHLAELDAGIGVAAPQRGSVVPMTGRAKGEADRPGRTKRAQEAGHRVKRAKVRGHS